MNQSIKALRGEELLAAMDEKLADYAVKNKDYTPSSRIMEEELIKDDTRTPFQHDRDRIIHSRAFRRLKGKTQVFQANLGDHYRTRLSHTLEVAQMSRSIARVFRLNEDLTEAIALGHDLGHPPFGHAAERKLNHILRGKDKKEICPYDIGGFRHNVNSLKVVDFFERYHGNFPGLNLTNWTREGILKHTSLIDKDYKERVFDTTLDISTLHPEVDTPCFLEGQVVALCDEIAQVTHDLEDAFRAKMMSVNSSKLLDIDIYHQAYDIAQTEKLENDIADYNLRVRLIRNLIRLLITDAINSTEEKIKTYNPGRPANEPIRDRLVVLGKTACQVEKLKKVLNEIMYDSYEVARMDIKGDLCVEKLFEAYYNEPARMPDYVFRKYNDALEVYYRKTQEKPPIKLCRENLREKIGNVKKCKPFNDILLHTIAEHIAGMTDQFAFNEYRQLFLP
jgi:dGTPase